MPFDKSPSFRSNQVGDLVNFLKAIYFYYAKTKKKSWNLEKKIQILFTLFELKKNKLSRKRI
jgi:hypothetical protein